MALFFIVVLLFIGLIVGMAFFALNKVKQSDLNLQNEIDSDDLLGSKLEVGSHLNEDQQKDLEHGLSAQKFLPYDTIQHDIVHLGGHRYRGFIECGSINYTTFTEDEQNQLEHTYQQFLNSIDFPTIIYVQTRTIDNEEMVRETEEDAELTKKIYPDIKTLHKYCDNYKHQMATLGDTLQSNKQKKKYIIVTYDDANQFETLNDEEKYKHALSEMHNRCVIVSERLRGMGISTKIISTKEIYELIHSTFSKDCYSDIGNLIERDIIPSIVTSSLGEMMNDIPAEAKADRALVEAQKSIYSELYSPNVSEELKNEFIEILAALDDARDKVSKSHK